MVRGSLATAWQRSGKPESLRLHRPLLLWAVAALLIIHGSIHGLGVAWVFRLADVEELGGPTLFPGLATGDAAMTVFGVLWLASMLGFVAGGIAFVAGRSWAIPLIGTAAVVSLVPTIAWWRDAWIGALVSAAVVAVVVRSTTGPDTSGPGTSLTRKRLR